MSNEVIYRNPLEIESDYKRLSTLLKSDSINEETRKTVSEAIVRLKQEIEPLTKLSYAELEQTLVDMFSIGSAEQLVLLFEICKLELEQLLNEKNYEKYGLHSRTINENIVSLNKAKQAQLEKFLKEDEEVNAIITIMDIPCNLKGKIYKVNESSILIKVSEEIMAEVDGEKFKVIEKDTLVSIPKTVSKEWHNELRLDIPNKFDKEKFSFKKNKPC